MSAETKRFDFTPRAPGRSFAAKGGLKDWPDEWRCKTCAWSATKNPNAKRIWCRAWHKSMWANSDRACYEEPLEMLREREAYEKAKGNQ